MRRDDGCDVPYVTLSVPTPRCPAPKCLAMDGPRCRVSIQLASGDSMSYLPNVKLFPPSPSPSPPVSAPSRPSTKPHHPTQHPATNQGDYLPAAERLRRCCPSAVKAAYGWYILLTLRLCWWGSDLSALGCFLSFFHTLTVAHFSLSPRRA